eukprot:5784948-Prymnesium_polylepis.1
MTHDTDTRSPHGPHGAYTEETDSIAVSMRDRPRPCTMAGPPRTLHAIRAPRLGLPPTVAEAKLSVAA